MAVAFLIVGFIELLLIIALTGSVDELVDFLTPRKGKPKGTPK